LKSDDDVDRVARSANFILAPDAIVNSSPTAPNLYGLGTRQWIAGWLDPEQIASRHYYGYEDSPFVDTDMVTFVVDDLHEDLDEDRRAEIEQAFDKVAAALAAEADLPTGAQGDPPSDDEVAEGVQLMTEGLFDVLDSAMVCTDCHKFGEYGDLGAAPDLTGYMSRQWLIEFISNPSAERFYEYNNDRMPQFAPHDDPALNQLDEKSLGLIVDWLRRDWYRPQAVSDQAEESEDGNEASAADEEPSSNAGDPPAAADDADDGASAADDASLGESDGVK